MGRWGIYRSLVIMGHHVILCPTHPPELYYREAKTFTKIASASKYPIEGYGNLLLTFRSCREEVLLLLCDVALVTSLSYHVFSLNAAADRGNKYTGTTDGFMVDFITGEKLFFPSVGRLNFLYAYRPNALLTRLPMLPLRLVRCPTTVTPLLTSMISTSPTPMPMRDSCANP